MTAQAIDGPRQPPAGGGAPEQLVILLHGLGADGDDLIALAPYFARVLPGAYFVAPHAPEPCDMAPVGYQWFAISDFGPAGRLAGVQGAAPVLDAFIDRELARHGLAEDQLVLVGFSQGTMMALHVALRRQREVAGILGYSGLLAGPELLADEARVRPPILLVHGDGDDLLPVQHLFEAVDGLGRAGMTAEWHVSQGAGHTIAQDGLELGMAFLARVLA
ncbi:MAG: prolyl oligopeptidase family serine peptidase [Alphaproteobacteria bacterium]|nr:prolyl oligopeptidase family serine peptidase [Alphaproteobacteria bacterium]MDP6815444.1 prolyl oligopeptidase family serine peptidase [Alphaproteobacteria bacterium]